MQLAPPIRHFGPDLIRRDFHLAEVGVVPINGVKHDVEKWSVTASGAGSPEAVKEAAAAALRERFAGRALLSLDVTTEGSDFVATLVFIPRNQQPVS